MTDPLSDLFAVCIIESSNNLSTIVEANQLLSGLCGFSKDEIIGESLDILIPERSRAAHNHYTQGFMHHPSTRPMGPDREVVILHKDGREIRVWIGLAPLDETRVTAVILPMDIGRSYGLGKVKELVLEENLDSKQTD